MGAEIITIVVAIAVLSGVVTAGSIHFNRKATQDLNKSLNDKLDQIEEQLSYRLDQLGVYFGERCDKIEERTQYIAQYTEETREKLHNVRENQLRIVAENTKDYPSRSEFNQLSGDVKILKERQ